MGGRRGKFTARKMRVDKMNMGERPQAAGYIGALGRHKGTHKFSEDRDDLINLKEKVYLERGFDFRRYKESTLIRCVSRRICARGVQIYTDYARVLDNDQTEYDRLFMDLTINVTRFFRDEEAFKSFENVFLPALTTKGEKNIRIWSVGCATGDEFATEFLAIRQEIPIIMCTGFNEHITGEKVKEMGIRKFFMKLLVMSELAEAVREVLDA
jgi:hypothetical protein